jgi:hypothetical protein
VETVQWEGGRERNGGVARANSTPARRRRRRPERRYELVLQVVEIMLTLVTVNVPPLPVLALELGLLLDGDDADGDDEDGDELLGDAELSMRPVTITW